MKNRLLRLFVSLAPIGGLSTWAIAQEPAKKPNIVHIVADDLGWKDVGFNGCTDIKTPNIDALASGGAKLSQFYVQPMCTPTRAAIMTGRYPFRHGLQTAVIPSVSAYGLDTSEWLMPQCLKEAGYKTAIIGASSLESNVEGSREVAASDSIGPGCETGAQRTTHELEPSSSGVAGPALRAVLSGGRRHAHAAHRRAAGRQGHFRRANPNRLHPFQNIGHRLIHIVRHRIVFV